MSVLIKGMDMPKNCDECLFGFQTFTGSEYIYLCNVKKLPIPNETYTVLMEITEAVEERKRDDDCPLIEVETPHGRLIDTDTLVENFKDKDANGINLTLDRYAIDCIDSAPTVIEAEE